MTLTQRLDYESLKPPQLSVQLVAYTPDQRSATATIIVSVTDTNDHSPQFNKDVSMLIIYTITLNLNYYLSYPLELNFNFYAGIF